MQTQIEPRSAAEIILSTRQAQRMTTRDMAAALGVSQNAISLWENKATEPSDERVKDWLVDGRDWVKQMGLAIFWSRHGAEVSAMANSLPQAKPGEAA